MHKKWFFFLFIALFIFPTMKFMGPFAFFVLPLAFFWLFAGSRHSEGWCTPHHHGYDGEKPKRNYVETVDGEFLEIIDEPKRA